jgi:hypothetical protein
VGREALVAAPELGPWEPLSLGATFELFRAAPFRWWFAGGHALELHLGRSWRHHDDTDVGVIRRDAPAIRLLLADWDIHVAAAGRLTPWSGGALEQSVHQDNLWARRRIAGPWQLDITVGEGDDEAWIYRRDERLRIPWEDAVLRTAAGVSYLAPELQLLFKSMDVRNKDLVDAREVIPELSDQQRGLLVRHLPVDHDWQVLLGTAGGRTGS